MMGPQMMGGGDSRAGPLRVGLCRAVSGPVWARTVLGRAGPGRASVGPGRPRRFTRRVVAGPGPDRPGRG